MSGQEISIKSSDGGEFMGYLALPEGGSGPGVVVIQEIFGVNDVMRGITDAWQRKVLWRCARTSSGAKSLAFRSATKQRLSGPEPLNCLMASTLRKVSMT